jgi:uncharacterized protein (TIGR02466 family)
MILFGEPVEIYNLNVDNKKILNDFKKFKYRKIPESIADFYGSISFNILDKLPSLKKQINLKVKDFIENVLEYETDFKITSSWTTKTLSNGKGHKHHHAHSFVSGVYYPFGHDEFKIKFHIKHFNKFWQFKIKNYNTINSRNWWLPIKDNTLLLFQSDLEHEININNSNIERYSLAFNVLPKGEIGFNDSKIKL